MAGERREPDLGLGQRRGARRECVVVQRIGRHQQVWLALGPRDRQCARGPRTGQRPGQPAASAASRYRGRRWPGTGRPAWWPGPRNPPALRRRRARPSWYERSRPPSAAGALLAARSQPPARQPRPSRAGRRRALRTPAHESSGRSTPRAPRRRDPAAPASPARPSRRTLAAAKRDSAALAP